MRNAFPALVAVDGDDGIDGVEDGGEVARLIEVERYVERIDCAPNEPLLYILACQHPHANDAQRCGEGIAERYVAVRERSKHPC